jgi:aerobic carbon-monoxide dehydrogenase medium subunit
VRVLQPGVIMTSTNPPSDLNGKADYRRHLARVLTRRAVAKAAGL